ncbi:MAG TPA: O-methyltransferase [Chromatiales bacterium]|nr:O-methyltransferase [Chromatiales bacterium]
MSRRSLGLSDALHAYLLRTGVREPPLLSRLREETARDPMARMQIAPEQGRFMELLVSILGARRAIEIGTFTGYSALWIARALPPDGLLVCCDISETWTRVARRYWAEAGLDDRIRLHLAPALETLDGLLAQGEAGSFDFAFIDADKKGYAAYFERCLRLLRPGGVVAVDNVFWDGAVVDETPGDEDTQAIRAFNERLAADDRVALSVVPVGDGLALARKR